MMEAYIFVSIIAGSYSENLNALNVGKVILDLPALIFMKVTHYLKLAKGREEESFANDIETNCRA